MPRIGARQWTTISCASFEPRSIALPAWIANAKVANEHFVLRIQDPINKYTTEVESRTDSAQEAIRGLLAPEVNIRTEKLDAEPTSWNQLAIDACSGGNKSIILDITSMPKRVFLFLTKRILSFSHVRDFVVTYTRAESYKEGLLTENAEPADALPGFGRIIKPDSSATLVVGVGYTATNIGDLLQQARGSEVKFIFPFPPGSPAFRRSWNLLHNLIRDVQVIKPEIERVHAMDMFRALDLITAMGQRASGPVDLIPLGPKPHTLAMALAHRRIGDKAEILYSQPRVYHPDYSSGIAKNRYGRSDIQAYCLRREHKDYC